MAISTTRASMIHESFCYDDAAHASYEQHGFCIFDRFLTDAAVQELLGHAERIVGETPDCISDTKKQMWLNPH